MILSNYWKLMYGIEKYAYAGAEAGGVNVGIKNLSGQEITDIIFTSTTNSNVATAQRNTMSFDAGKFVKFGNGSTEITKDTYAMPDDITSQISDVSLAVVYSYNDEYKKTIILSGENETENPVTINRIGYGKNVGIYAGSSYGTDTVLLAIVDLDSPITVQPGESFSAAFEWTES